MANLKDTLTEIVEIGVQIARLSERSKELRMSLMSYHTSLPKSHTRPTVAQVLVGTRLFAILPTTKLADMDPSSKVIDVTVTFDDVFIATDETV